jgi:hypothetical protein
MPFDRKFGVKITAILAANNGLDLTITVIAKKRPSSNQLKAQTS